MNVIVVNENKKIMDQLDVDIIKKIDGQFEVSELLSKFVNLYFNKIILDVTSLKNYEDVNTIINLSKAIDRHMNRFFYSATISSFLSSSVEEVGPAKSIETNARIIIPNITYIPID